MKGSTGIILAALVVGAACDGNVNIFGSPTQTSRPAPEPSVSPTPTKTPTPSPTPTPTPAESCRIDYMTLRPVDGLSLAFGAEAQVDLTPYQTIINPDGSVAQREVSKACNDPRASSVVWTSSSASVAVLAGGFNPTVRRFGTGFANVYATLEGKTSNLIPVRTP